MVKEKNYDLLLDKDKIKNPDDLKVSKIKGKTQLELEKLAHQNELLAIENKHKEANEKKREELLSWTKKVVKYYLIYVAVFLVLVAIKIPKLSEWFTMYLEPEVIITLLATTTATIIGMMALIIGSLFPKNLTDKKSKNHH